ncbi:hypothetical protein CDAR_601051 [Caerostris darwini]|uniref:C2H2-type domain-containing protein n=1 Tax=Caerostris darwini TaxID=1538125 RepID=A0AAV4VTZ3_9ARAC|nr:hypothetical protein CDAR_601051 [Caerostris darwini]
MRILWLTVIFIVISFHFKDLFSRYPEHELIARSYLLDGKSIESVKHATHKYCCQYCSKCFTRKRSLMDHTNIHTGRRPKGTLLKNKGRTFCTDCGADINIVCGRREDVTTHTKSAKHQSNMCETAQRYGAGRTKKKANMKLITFMPKSCIVAQLKKQLFCIATNESNDNQKIVPSCYIF